MKRIYLIVALGMFASFTFAQKKAVKSAKSEMNSNKFDDARLLITPALTDPESATDPETWKVAGDIEYKTFELEKTNEMTKSLSGKSANQEVMYTALYNMYDPYLKADELSEIPDEKGKVKNKYRKDIAKNILDGYQQYINGGLYYNEKGDYTKASEFFERYWDIPSLPIFDDNQQDFNTADTTFQTIKYYATITAIQGQDHPRAIRLLNKMINEPYINNSTYKESDIYELLASEYSQAGDSVNYLSMLNVGSSKFPSSKFFTPNLINEYIKSGKNQEAIDYLDQAIANDPSSSCDLMSVKASLFVDNKDYAGAEKSYLKTLSSDPDCERGLEGLGILYVLQAQDLKERVAQTTSRKDQVEIDKQTIDKYNKALPYLERYNKVLEARNASSKEIRNSLMKLQNVYYNLSILGVDKEKELTMIDKTLQELN